MLENRKDEQGRYLPEFRLAVLGESHRGGVWAAVERFGVPYSTVLHWRGVERRRAGEAARTLEDQGQAASSVVLQAAAAPTPPWPQAGEGPRQWRVHSPEEKAAALRDLETLGISEAALRHGVTQQCLRNWRRAALGIPLGGAQSEVDAGALAAAPDPVDKPGSGVPGGVQIREIDRATFEAITGRREVPGKRYTPSQQAAAVGEAEALGVARAAKKAGVTRHSLYRWVRRARREAGVPMQRRWEQTEVEKQRDLEILHEWHKQPGLGPMQIRSQLRRRGVRTSVHTVRRVMEEQGYRPPKVKSHSHHERYEAVRPNQLWHLDFVHRHIHLAGTFTLILLDDHSRYVVGAAVGDAERADTVIETFEAAVAKHGRPEAVMTDRGSAFWAWRGIGRFSRLLEELGVDQYVAEDKELNGKVEVFNANVAKELFDKQRFDDVGQLQAALVAHLDWYNHRRTHQGLGGLLVPADRYYGRAEEVQRQLETGAGKVEDPHGLALEARLLSLFQVASRGGQTEVWLLGKRIL